ncbi:MAG: hypothetical protein EP298_05395 [Gammaproteobacteria bacterium]|nr:MAG: hypothetical protein EP298_05395 [Gammaproteobacteria bacterium]UTW43231.1 hypothetical protein KFE69_03555 [bacterium SCSIO 12844]
MIQQDIAKYISDYLQIKDNDKKIKQLIITTARNTLKDNDISQLHKIKVTEIIQSKYNKPPIVIFKQLAKIGNFSRLQNKHIPFNTLFIYQIALNIIKNLNNDDLKAFLKHDKKIIYNAAVDIYIDISHRLTHFHNQKINKIKDITNFNSIEIANTLAYLCKYRPKSFSLCMRDAINTTLEGNNKKSRKRSYSMSTQLDNHKLSSKFINFINASLSYSDQNIPLSKSFLKLCYSGSWSQDSINIKFISNFLSRLIQDKKLKFDKNKGENLKYLKRLDELDYGSICDAFENRLNDILATRKKLKDIDFYPKQKIMLKKSPSKLKLNKSKSKKNIPHLKMNTKDIPSPIKLNTNDSPSQNLKKINSSPSLLFHKKKKSPSSFSSSPLNSSPSQLFNQFSKKPTVKNLYSQKLSMIEDDIEEKENHSPTQ